MGEHVQRNLRNLTGGMVIFVAGLVVVLLRSDIAMSFVGRDAALNDFFNGPSRIQDALDKVTVGGALLMILGALGFAVGLYQHLGKK